MTKTEIIAQLIGIFGILSLFVMYQQSSRTKYLAFKILSDVIWAAHYLLLGAIGGAIPNVVGIVRELTFLKEPKKRYARRILAAMFITVNASLAIYLADSLIQLMPICASALVTVSLTFRKTKSIRLLTVPICLTFLIYDLLVGSWSGAINEAVSLFSIISKLIREHCSQKN